jgi:hypothetical protein
MPSFRGERHYRIVDIGDVGGPPRVKFLDRRAIFAMQRLPGLLRTLGRVPLVLSYTT